MIMPAPNQNRDGKINPARLTSITLAETLTRLKESKIDKPLPRIHPWNMVGANIKGSEQDLKAKYEYLKSKGFDFPKLNIERDNSAEFLQFARDYILNFAKSGVIYQDMDRFEVCGSCSYVIGISTATRITKCSQCSGTEIHQENRNGLFINIDQNIQNNITQHFPSYKSKRHLAANFHDLPRRIFLNKQRESGLDLDFVGFAGQKLDPKFGISLLPHYISQKYQQSKITQIQGYETATNTAPFTLSIPSLVNYQYLLLGHIHNDWVSDDAEYFTLAHLPFYLIGFDGSLSKDRINQLHDDYSKTIRKIQGLKQIQNVVYPDVLPQIISKPNIEVEHIINLLLEYDVVEGIKALKDYIKKINKEARESGIMNMEDLESIETVTNLIYNI